MKSLAFVQEMDFLAKRVDGSVVLQSATMLGITSQHKHYSSVLETVERNGFENYKDLFEAIKRVASKRKEEWGSIEMPTELVEQHHLWMAAIHRGVEGARCALCGSHGCSHQ